MVQLVQVDWWMFFIIILCISILKNQSESLQRLLVMLFLTFCHLLQLCQTEELKLLAAWWSERATSRRNSRQMRIILSCGSYKATVVESTKKNKELKVSTVVRSSLNCTNALWTHTSNERTQDWTLYCEHLPECLCKSFYDQDATVREEIHAK